MQSNPSSAIGIYDSGVGGISVLRSLRASLPKEAFIYVADSRFAPYGDRDQAFLESRAHDIFDFFTRQRVKAAVLACNTISIAAAAALRSKYQIPIVAMEPAIKPATQLTKTGTVLVLATNYTTQSPSVARLCALFADNKRVLLQACPGLAEQVERGEFDSRQTRHLLERYVLPGLQDGADIIVLGCTHYAFLSRQIAEIAGPEITLIEPSAAIARQLARRLQDLSAPGHHPPEATQFYSSGDTAQLHRFLEQIAEPASGIWPIEHRNPVSKADGQR